MATGDIPTRADLADVVGYLQAGLDGTWTIQDWQAWSNKAFQWTYRTTRGCLLLQERVRALEAENALLRVERDRALRASAPVAPTIVPAMRRATPPPPPAPSSPESSALAQSARRPLTGAEREARRKLMETVGALVDRLPPEEVPDVWREVSSVELEFADPTWGAGDDTVFEDPHGY